MEIFSEIIAFIGCYFTRGIFISVLVVILSRKLFKEKLSVQYAIVIIRWVMFTCAALNVAFFMLLFLLPSTAGGFISLKERATGPYAWAFWLMTVGAILPLILFFKKLGANIYLVLVLSIAMNIGWLMESLVTHINIIHRDYVVDGFRVYLPFKRELAIVLKGLLFGVLVVIIGNLPVSGKMNK